MKQRIAFVRRWGESSDAFAAMFAHLFLPDAPVEQRDWYAELQRKSSPLSSALSKREHEILVHLARGLTNREIAAQLCIGDKTVRNRITHIFEKLGVNSRAQAIVLAKESGL